MHASRGGVFLESANFPAREYQLLERQANRFAAALLMPLPLIMRELFLVCDRLRVDTKVCIVELMCDSPASEWLWRSRFLPAITRRFGVSLSAAVNRFRDVKLRDGRQQFIPSAIAQRAIKSRWQQSPLPAFTFMDGKPVPVQEAEPEALF
jgi:Zn-dependent peptidase ImmA (M78 family)